MSTLDDDLKRAELRLAHALLDDRKRKLQRNAQIANATKTASAQVAAAGVGAAKATGRGAWWLAATIGKIFLTWLVLWAVMVWCNTERVPGGIGQRIDFYGQPAATWTVPVYGVILLIRKYDRRRLLIAIGAVAALFAAALIAGSLLG